VSDGVRGSSANVVVVLVTGPDIESLARLGRTIVDEKLAACVNLLDGVRSIYRWEGAIEDEGEALAIFKTTAERLDPLERRIVELHPYDVPEVIALPVVGGSNAYLAWIVGETA
jgi:periplasmic divalent cation tolerance protein